MSQTIRNRRAKYDNIEQGGAAGRERTVLGDSGVTELYGGGYGTGSTDSTGRNNLSGGVTDFRPDAIPDGAGGTTDATDENTGSSNAPDFVTNP